MHTCPVAGAQRRRKRNRSPSYFRIEGIHVNAMLPTPPHIQFRWAVNYASFPRCGVNYAPLVLLLLIFSFVPGAIYMLIFEFGELCLKLTGVEKKTELIDGKLSKGYVKAKAF